tara:strand:+ start:554 stop:859 length:306 start_codon:yes stop_codon:yes gene_type:complete
MTAYELIKNSYDLETFKAIAQDGPESGAASKHIDLKTNAAFYDEHESEIVEFISNQMGEEQLDEMETEEGIPLSKENEDTKLLYKNACTLTFIELIAHEVT